MHWLSLLFWPYSLLCLAISLLYFVIQYRIRDAWEEIAINKTDLDFYPKKKYSIIIAARNEEQYINACLQSILQSNFNSEQLEVILVDDHSTDKTQDKARSISDARLKIIGLQNDNGKKAAIKRGISEATGDWVITTDADCEFAPDVLPLLAQQAEQNNYQFIAGGVLIKSADNWMGKFQEVDLMATMGVTGAGIHLKKAYLANGAHLAYAKATFEAVGGFEGIDQYASGDDMLLLHKIAKRYPGQIHFLKNPEAVVFTKAEKTFSQFFQQRLRWASKGNAFQNSDTWWIMVTVFLNSFLICINVLLCIFSWNIWGPILALQLTSKWSGDALVLQTVSRFYKKRIAGNRFLIGSLFHAFYVAAIGLMAQFKKTYRWKGRLTR